MQKALTPRHSSDNDCFAGDAGEDAEETDIPLLSVSIGERPLCTLQFANAIDQLWQKQNSRQQHQVETIESINIWMNGKTLEEVDHFKHIGSTQTKDRTSIKEVKIRLAQVHTLSHDMASNTMEKQRHQFSYKDWLNSTRVICTVNTALWMWELDADGEFGEANPGIWTQMLQRNAWHIIQRA